MTMMKKLSKYKAITPDMFESCISQLYGDTEYFVYKGIFFKTKH